MGGAMILYSARTIIYGLVYSSPPYILIAFGLLEFNLNIYFVSVINYSSVVAPQSLIATAITIGSVMCWIVGLSLGSFLSGFLVQTFGLRVMFYIVGVAGIIFFSLYIVIYHIVIKKYETNPSDESNEDCEPTDENLSSK